MSADRLVDMFERRKVFIRALGDSTEPLDLSQKDNQRLLRDIAVRGIEEVWEAQSLLKNWKPHRKTDVPEFDREKYLEEWVDAFNYFFTTLILAGFDEEDLHQMYVKKDEIIHERLKSGY